MEPMSILGAALGLDGMYRGKRPRMLPMKKPHFCLMPKYVTPISYASDILDAEDRLAALDKRIAALGFEQESQDAGSATFIRGHLLGDFSTKIVKLRLIFDRPLDKGANVVVEYASPMLIFDTGDLWAFATELKELLERPAKKSPVEEEEI